MKCRVCDRELQVYERPQPGLPPLCDACARKLQVWPLKQPTTEEVSV